VRHATYRLEDRLGLAQVIPTDEPRPEWLRYGVDVKSAEPFRRNLAAIVDVAASRDEPVLLMSFAFHIADGYSRQAFEALQLDYTRHRSPLRWWGTVEGVRAGIEAHNRVVSELAAERGTLFVDQAALMPADRRYYNDVCHFTVDGSELFVEHMMPVLRQVMNASRGAD
jgi:hypothetical protein